MVLSPNRILGSFTPYLKDPANRKTANHVPKKAELAEHHNEVCYGKGARVFLTCPYEGTHHTHRGDLDPGTPTAKICDLHGERDVFASAKVGKGTTDFRLPRDDDGCAHSVYVRVGSWVKPNSAPMAREPNKEGMVATLDLASAPDGNDGANYITEGVKPHKRNGPHHSPVFVGGAALGR